MNAAEIAQSGPLLFAAGLALLAGLISFASPCVVPLVPGYLAYLSALVGAEAPAVSAAEPPSRGRGRVLGATALFVLGFTVVFAAGLGTVVWLADALLLHEVLLQRIGGVLTILMGLVFLGWVPLLQRDVRIHQAPRGGVLGAPVLGAVFGLGWTPCIGPTLTGVLSLAAGTSGSSTRGLLLVLVYCVGLGLPFLLIAFGARWAVLATGWLRRHGRAVQITGGVMLLAVGALLVSGLWSELTIWLRSTVISDVELPL